MPVVRYRPDPKKPYKLSPAQRTRIDALTEQEIEAAAVSDPDARLLTDAELRRARAPRLIKSVRSRMGLGQEHFARRYRISLARLRDWEQGRSAPDSAMLAYIKVIQYAPRTVERAIGQRALGARLAAPPSRRSR